jgi:GDP-L-fucose synthase
MKILLTGGNGMLGRAIRRMAKQHYPDLVMHAPPRQSLDLLDLQAARQFFHNQSYDAVIHSAAKVGGIKANISDPVGFMVDNTLINTHVIQCAAENHIPRFINIGSSCMYPRDLGRLLREEDILTAPLEPTNEGYAIAKIAAARLCAYIAATRGFAYRTFIPCNLYGPDDNFDIETGHMIAAAIVKIHRAMEHNDSTVPIWGDGTARREFLFVDDVARFILAALPCLESYPQDINLGVGDDRTVNDYFAAVAQIIGFQGTFTHINSEPVGMARKLMDITRARKLGWNPETTLVDGLRLAYESYKANI